MKTATVLMTNHSLRAKGLKVWLLKSAIDTRSGADVIASRIGLCAIADAVVSKTDVISDMMSIDKTLNGIKPDIILVDECQFLSSSQIEDLRQIVSFDKIPVYCYGLKTDATSKLFEGSKRLFELSDTLVELETHCDCGEKAIINARIDENGNVISPNSQIDIGGNEKYKPKCYACWINGGKK
jgi:thymidine kinase